ncbi:neutral zinc metallopeptidase (plasmid) [Kribbella sp. CWNU-51]
MPEENADTGAGTAGGSPKPGHFLPGGAGDVLTESDLAAARPLAANRQQPLGLGKARSISAPDSTLRHKARPLPTDPDATGDYSGPPVAPLAGAPWTPLQGTRRTGGSRPVGWHSNPTRAAAQFSAEPPPVKPPRHYSRAVIAGLSALVLIILTGATIAGFKLIDSYGNTVDNPLSQPSVKKSQVPIPIPPDPTVTVTAPTVPDAVRVKQNKLYTVGKVPSVNCAEPSYPLTSQSNILKYSHAVVLCLDKAWGPLVKKAGYPFRPAKTLLISKQQPSDCTGDEPTRAFYCGYDESVNIDWKWYFDAQKQDRLGARTDLLDTLAHEYGHHVQVLTNIAVSSGSREGWMKSQASKLEENRRFELQASCLAAVFLGANKTSLGFTGAKLEMWEWQTKHSGDEYNPKKVRDHGSRKSQWLWAGPAFKSANPGSCNTFVAPAGKVS